MSIAELEARAASLFYCRLQSIRLILVDKKNSAQQRAMADAYHVSYQPKLDKDVVIVTANAAHAKLRMADAI